MCADKRSPSRDRVLGGSGGESAGAPTTASELCRMLREPLHRAAGGARRAMRWSARDDDDAMCDLDERAAEAFLRDAPSGASDRVFAPAAAALDLHVARMLAELHGGEILVRHVPSSTPSESGGTAIVIRVPALTRPMDNLMLEHARGACEVTAAAGPWNNPFATRIPDLSLIHI